MQFNSFEFILFFLPLTVIGYFLLNRIHEKIGKIFLIALSLWFYGAFGWDVLLLLGISLAVNFFISFLIRKRKAPRLLTAVGVIANIGILFYFKYFNFAISIIDDYFHGKIPFQNILLPVGISFYTFQQIAYLIDAYRGARYRSKSRSDELRDRVRADEVSYKTALYKGECEGNTVLDYLFYILFYPKLLMGPLVSQKELIPQLHEKSRWKINADNLVSGLQMFGFGLFKKVILADTFARAAGFTGGDSGYFSTGDLILMALAYTFQIYFDFSGYSDMATGVAKMLNFDLPINFDSPYKSYSIQEFWKRWHVTLTKFLTNYVYIPLGGNRKGKIRTYINILIVFLVSGIWHGASFTFILWGILNGLIAVFDRLTDKYRSKLNPVVQWGLTFLVLNVLFMLFQADSVASWWSRIMDILRFEDLHINEELLRCFVYPETEFFFEFTHLTDVNLYIRGLPMLIAFIAAFWICLVPENNYRRMKKRGVFTAIALSISVLWSLFAMSSESVFVYFGF